MKSPIEKWRLGYDAPDGARRQITAGAFDELVIDAAGIHIEVMYDGTELDDDGWAVIDVHIGTLHLYVNVHADGRRHIVKNEGTFVDDVLVEGT